MSDKNYHDGNSDYDLESFFNTRSSQRSDSVVRKTESYSKSDDTVRRTDRTERTSLPPVSGKKPESKTGCLGGFMYFIFIVSVSIILACAAWMIASDVFSLNKEEAMAEVTVPDSIFTQIQQKTTDESGKVTEKTLKSADMSQVSKLLKEAGIIKYQGLFELYSKVSNANLKIDPGTYQLSTQFDYRAIVKKMQYGSDSQVRTMVTFPEGFTMAEIFKRLEENRICSYDDLMDCAANTSFNYKFLEDIPLGDSKRLEGFLFPDTYEFYQGETPEATIDTFLQIFNGKITAEMYQKANAKGISIRDIVNIASMIETEAANDNERTQISSVIYNRYKADMPLGIDSAIQYVLPEHKDKLTADDFKIDSPYNTRLHTGLPPTPIASPGMASIKAALNPATTNYYYYALDKASNTHKFFTNSADFKAFVAKQGGY